MVKKTGILALGLGSLFLISLLFAGCGDGKKYEVDVTGHEVDIEITRLEDDLFAVKTLEDYQKLDQLDSNLIKSYKRGIMGPETRDGFIAPEESVRGYLDFINYADMRHLYNSVDSAFPDLGELEEELSLAFSHYSYYFPDRKIPKFYSIITPFRAQVVTTPDAMAICLDMYLGADFIPYRSPGLEFPEYLIQRFRRDYIARNAMKGWLETEFLPNRDGTRLLDEMVYRGKILHALDRMFPQMADSLKIGYQRGQIEWCEDNEAQIWSHLIDQDLLYSTEFSEYSGVISEGPFSKGRNIPQESPPKIAVWTGWQMVRQYMENEDVSLAELMSEPDNDKILRLSGYKP